MTSLGTLATSFALASALSWPADAGVIVAQATVGKATSLDAAAAVETEVAAAGAATEVASGAAMELAGVAVGTTAQARQVDVARLDMVTAAMHMVTTTATMSTTTAAVVDLMAEARAEEAAGWQTAGFSSALFDDADTAWPIAVSVVVRDARGTALLQLDRRVADGEPVEFTATVPTPDGEDGVRGTVIPRIHFGDVVELEYEVDATEAGFVDLSWGEYLLHRVELGARPEVGEHVLTASRADIVEVIGRGHQERLQTRHGALRITFEAHPVRG
jgi:hypothetical protein